jgi:2-polyprenyl-6-methoxyphenol hydroxylase-like FAD-dependent oxidoreductase
MTDVPVLVVGGGPVGLTASILLSQHGVRSLLVERHPGTSIHPKSRAINARTMEVYRQCGVERAIRDAGLPPERARYIIWTRTLAGEELERRVPWRATSDSQSASPVRTCICAQDDLEPVLRDFAERMGPGELRFSTELQGFEADADGVTATLADRRDGAVSRVRARYVIAADGAQSQVRTALGIRMLGRDAVYDSVNVLFRADLTPWTRERPAALYFVEHPAVTGTFLTINGVDRWGFLANGLAGSGLLPAELTPERCVSLIRTAAGVPDLAVEILGIVPWTAAARVAERYREGRVFLAGDAAHEMPPTGGFGLNTGVQDAHNLAWKLAAVLHRRAAPRLLDTYDAERRPVGCTVTEQSFANAVSMGRLGRQPGFARPEYLNEQGMIFGAAYGSTAVVPDGSAPPAPANPVTDYIPSARPGRRAPHVWLARDGARVSTIDLFGPRFVLLAGPKGESWRHAGHALGTLPLDVYVIDGDLGDPGGAWCTAYGVDPAGAVLVRPDGYVGWRSATAAAHPDDALRDAVTAILG